MSTFALAKMNDALVILVYPIVVGRSRPLDASMATEEVMAEQAFSPLEVVAQKYQVRIKMYPIQGRGLISAIIQEAEDEKVEHIVLGIEMGDERYREWNMIAPAILNHFPEGVTIHRYNSSR